MRKISWALALALVACAHENEPEAVEPETTATSGSQVQGPPAPQASAPASPAPMGGPVEEHSTQQQYGAYRDPAPHAGLHSEIHEALRADARVNERTIAVSVNGSTVFLGGYVSSEEQRGIAGEIVSQVPGVTEVFTHALRVRS